MTARKRTWINGLRDNWAVGVLAALVVGMLGTLYTINNERIASLEKSQAQLQAGLNQALANQVGDGEWRKAVMVRFDDIGRRIDGVTQDIRELRAGR